MTVPRNPLQPFTSVVRFLWSVAAVGLLLGLWHEIGSTFSVSSS